MSWPTLCLPKTMRGSGRSARRLPSSPQRKRSRWRARKSTGSRSSIADRKSTRLNSSHSQISYAVFCLEKIKHYGVHNAPHFLDVLREQYVSLHVARHPPHFSVPLLDVVDHPNPHGPKPPPPALDPCTR